ncbi:MAG TPA: thioredoxin family protein [Ignavibacteriaceae bacterium]|nr:thioredoxin family protein [Ignavibacteriaceae bacterium]
MIKKTMIISLMIIFSFGMLYAQESTPQPADKILNSALKKAKSNDKKVFLIFHASWCGWCKKLERAVKSPELKDIFNDYFVITYIDVLENKEKIKTLEDPGARDMMNKYGSTEDGLPFYLFIDQNSNVIADSKVLEGNENLGYPVSDEEINAFMKIIKKSAKGITEEQAERIFKYLKKQST